MEIRGLWKRLRTHPGVRGIVGLATMAATISALLGGPIWPEPDIHPKDTTDGSSLLLPFIVKNQSVLFPIMDANFLCRIDLILAVDSAGQRVTIRGFDIEAGTYNIPRNGVPLNVPCDTSSLLKTRSNGSLSIGGSDAMFVHKFPSGIDQPQAFIPPWKLLKTCVFIQVSYSIAAQYSRQLTSVVFQWPAVPGTHQWAEGVVGQNLTLLEDFDVGSFFGIRGPGDHPLRCSNETLPYYAMIRGGRIQLIPPPPIPILTGELGLQILPPSL